MNHWIQQAKISGFDEAILFDPRILRAREDVRSMCASDRCKAYGKNWTCPPACGTLEECQTQMHSYKSGILLQTIGHMQKTIDSKCYRETEKQHIKNLYSFAEQLRHSYPDALCLGAGGCRICKSCAYPNPCRFPTKAMSSMEGYGLFVTQVCRDAGLPYYYGEKTITYTACALF